MRTGKQFQFIFILIICATISLIDVGCANIGQPTGGPRDTAAPILEKAIPVLKSLNAAQLYFVFTQLDLCVSDHQMYSDFNRATIQFLTKQCQ